MIRLAKEVSPQAREQELRNFLGNFNFTGDMVKQAVGSMSGGEKARLVLCMIVWQRPNLLLLDEPTNHLDLATREALSMALNEFEGTVMLVSHDRALLRAVCDEFWLVSRGGVSPFDGDLDDYQRYLLDESRRLREQAQQAAKAQAQALAQARTEAVAPAPKPAPAPVQAPPPAPEAPRLSGADQRRADAQRRQDMLEKTRPLKRELAEVEKRLEVLNAEQAQLNERLMAPLPPTELAEIGKRLKAIEQDLAEREERWLALGEALQALES
jgi:ATP-binding cassette subfamily F protein 3